MISRVLRPQAKHVLSDMADSIKNGELMEC
jgi:hypothetical protein